MEAVSAVACGKAPVAGRLPGSEAVGPGVGVGRGGRGRGFGDWHGGGALRGAPARACAGAVRW